MIVKDEVGYALFPHVIHNLPWYDILDPHVTLVAKALPHLFDGCI